MDRIYVLMYHPADWDDNQCEQYSWVLEAYLNSKMRENGDTRTISVISSRKDRLSMYKGDESAWRRSILSRYHVHITVSEYIGRSTANILTDGRLLGKKLRYFDGNVLHTITGVRAVHQEDWRSGWKVKY